MRTHDEEQIRPPTRPEPRLAASNAAHGELSADPSAVLSAGTFAHLQRTAGNAGVTSLLGAEEGRSPVLDVVGSGGSPLDAATRSEMESSFGEDFGAVRLHTGAAAAESARSVQAHAYTVGSDIVLGDGHDPDSPAGRHTLAHELTHVIQQRLGPVVGTPTGSGVSVSEPTDPFEQSAERMATFIAAGEGPHEGSVERSVAQGQLDPDFSRPYPQRSDWTRTLQRRPETTTVRQESDDGEATPSKSPPPGGSAMTVWTGTKEEWSVVLKDMDSSEQYLRYLWGFLELSNDPAMLYRNPNLSFRSGIARVPTSTEKLAFLIALYESGVNLDLWYGGAFEPGPWGEMFLFADPALSQFLRENQSLYLGHMSNKGEKVSPVGVGAVAEQAGPAARIAMIINAGATAHKGIDLIMTANRLGGQARQSANARAHELIRNSGRTIRAVLEVHNARVSFQQAAVDSVFDIVWDFVPGGGTLESAGKALLKLGLSTALNQATANDGPADQADAIDGTFVKTCNTFVDDGHISSEDAQNAINGFAGAWH